MIPPLTCNSKPSQCSWSFWLLT